MTTAAPRTLPTNGTRTSSGDEELQYWYDNVLSAFADGTTSEHSDLDTIYSTYTDEHGAGTGTNLSSSTYSSAATSIASPVPPPKSVRPLPPTPGIPRSASASASASPTPVPVAMPSPEPYQHSVPLPPPPPPPSSAQQPPNLTSYPSHKSNYSIQSDSSGGRTTNGQLRTLPTPPGKPGLPSDPRPPAAAHRVAEVRGGVSEGSLSRSSSTRPPGTKAPATPGLSSYQYDTSLAPGLTPHSHHYAHDHSRQPSTSTILQSSWVSSPDQYISPDPSATLLRNDSASTGQSLGRNGSIASFSDLHRQTSFASFPEPSPFTPHAPLPTAPIPGSSKMAQEAAHSMTDVKGKAALELHDQDVDEEFWEEDEDPNRFVNFSLLSHISVQLRDKVPRGTHVKGSIPYPRAFTGKDIVSTIQSQIQRELLINHNISTNDRRVALQIARSLQSQLFFCEVEWGGRMLQDGVEDVYMFLDDQAEGPGTSDLNDMTMSELPTGVITVMTKCYSPSCAEGEPCYSSFCPRKGKLDISVVNFAPTEEKSPESWADSVDPDVLKVLSESEISRQTIIRKIIDKEEQYIKDLDHVETNFIRPLRNAYPAVIDAYKLDDFIDDVFGNILDLRECNKRLLEWMYVRQREQAPVIQRIGDIFLETATIFRLAYPTYVGHLPLAEKRMKDEIEANPDFRLFLEQRTRQTAGRQQDTVRLDLKHFLNRPAEHLQRYPTVLDAILSETAQENPDADYLARAIEAIKNLHSMSQLRTFQSAMGKGVTGKWEWHDLVGNDVRQKMTKQEMKRQAIIFELIKGEMAYVKDLENINVMYIQPLRNADPPIIPPDRLEQFIQDVFHNFAELHAYHRRMVNQFHEIQSEQHPVIHSITAALFDAALNFREAYLDYIPNYPIAAYRIDHEMENNPAFKNFVDACVRHQDAHRLDMKNFINRPIPRLLRYELLLKNIYDETPNSHDDREEIPHVIDVIKSIGKEAEPGVVSAKTKVELWRYNSSLIFKTGEYIDMDLLNENRSLIYTGKLLRQPDSGLEWNGWSELFVLLFDNYMVMTKPKERDGITKYHVNRRPIPLDLLRVVSSNEPPTMRGAGLLRGFRGNNAATTPHDGPQAFSPNSATTPDGGPVDARQVFPISLHHNGRLGGNLILYAETSSARTEWRAKLDEALGLRQVVQDANKVFDIEVLSSDTFLVPPQNTTASPPAWSHENSLTGKVTCSVPFNTADGRGLVAIGCAEGVWIGFRHDSRSMRRVLHLKMVTQCAMLESFGLFLVLADKSLFAYHIEALVPSSPNSAHASATPEKLNGTKDVHFFSVGTLLGRTLVIYMKKKGLDSVFRVLEPVVERINDRTRAPAGFGSKLGFRPQKSAWFRVFRDFFLPSESFDLIFLKAKIAILCTKGFEIMDLNDFKSVTIPQRDDIRQEKLAKRCESCKPLGMFRSNEDEFLLCYDEFGLYVDKHGDPSRTTGTIEWEGTAEKVALHHPYILLFDSRFIEIRHVETGRLAQIITGKNISCIWDGRSQSSNISRSPAGMEDEPDQEAKVHAVMDSTDSMQNPNTRGRAVAQRVFELIPTVPLYLPGSLASPSEPTYFAQGGFSPPRSPSLRPASSYRS